MPRKTYRDIIITHTAMAHSVPIKDLRWGFLQKSLTISANTPIFGAAHLEIFSPGWNFNSLNLDEILSRMRSENSVKIELRYMQKLHHGKPSRNFTTVWTNGAEFSFYVNRLKITHAIIKTDPGRTLRRYFHIRKRNWWMPGQNNINKMIKWDNKIENLKLPHLL